MASSKLDSRKIKSGEKEIHLLSNSSFNNSNEKCRLQPNPSFLAAGNKEMRPQRETRNTNKTRNGKIIFNSDEFRPSLIKFHRWKIKSRSQIHVIIFCVFLFLDIKE